MFWLQYIKLLVFALLHRAYVALDQPGGFFDYTFDPCVSGSEEGKVITLY